MIRPLALAIALLLPLQSAASELDDALGRGGVRVANGDLVAIYSDHTWSGKTAQGGDFSLKLSRDGTAILSFKGKEESGKWRVDGEHGCTSYPNLRGGKEACFAITKMPDATYAAYDASGALNSTFSIK